MVVTVVAVEVHLSGLGGVAYFGAVTLQDPLYRSLVSAGTLVVAPVATERRSRP